MLATTAAANSSLFPEYTVIEPNVLFWEQVYAKYTTTQAIVHDSTDLRIIYDVIDLVPQNRPGARTTNRKRMKRAKKRYQGILKRLASNPEPANDRHRRVAGLFGPGATAQTYRQAGSRIRCQIGQKDRFIEGIKRSGAYIDKIREIFRSYGLPEELAFLPHVESSFDVKAYSKFGAAGIWQFTRSTGKRFMKVGYTLDERRDPILASHAAAKLLKENYEILASWPLAITAYNHGQTGMKRAKLKVGDYPAIFTSYTSRTFKFASRNFYSEFIAARRIASDYQAYFGPVPLDRPIPYQRFILEGFVPFDALCDHFNISPDRLQRMNPALREPVINGQKLVPKNYDLRLPFDGAASHQALASIPESLFQPRQKPSRFYTVQRGDTAGKIAKLHGIRLKELILANNLSRRATIYPHQTLRIPFEGETGGAETAPSEKPLATLLASTGKSPEIPNQTQPGKPAAPPYPAPVLASMIPSPAPSPEPPVATDTAQGPSEHVMAAEVTIERTMVEQGETVGMIRVEVEETLGHYAEWAGVRTLQIRKMNGLPYGTTLHLHQKLKIPLEPTAIQTFEQNRYEYHKRLQEDFFSAYRISALFAYRIQRGDNFWTLCQTRFEIPMWLLSNCNPQVDFADLRVQQKIVIPVVEKIDQAQDAQT
jgi:membrane-bound lytic murein transglycosylase D